MSGDVDAPTPAEAIPEALNTAIRDVIARHEGGFVTKWVALIETADASGEVGLWPLAGEGAKSWEVVGMLQHALHLELAKTLREQAG